MYHQHETAPLKRTFKRKIAGSMTSTQESEFEFGAKSSKVIRNSVPSQDVLVESPTETNGIEGDISFSAMNDSNSIYSLNESRISISSPCNPFKVKSYT